MFQIIAIRKPGQSVNDEVYCVMQDETPRSEEVECFSSVVEAYCDLVEATGGSIDPDEIDSADADFWRMPDGSLVEADFDEGGIVTDVVILFDSGCCDYAVVELDDDGDSFAFIWGNIRSNVGFPVVSRTEDNTDEKGADYFDTLDGALEAWRDCAEALCATDVGNLESAGAEMLARLS